MAVDVVDLRSFYSPAPSAMWRGGSSAAAVRGWVALVGLRVLGIGYATPYLRAAAARGGARAGLHARRAGRGELAVGRPVGLRARRATMMPLPDASWTACWSCTRWKPANSPGEVLAESGAS